MSTEINVTTAAKSLSPIQLEDLPGAFFELVFGIFFIKTFVAGDFGGKNAYN